MKNFFLAVSHVRNVELVVLILREVSKPLNEELEGIIGGTSVIGGVIVAGSVGVGKADSSGALQVQHVRNTIPAIRRLLESGLVGATSPEPRAIFVQKAIQRRATRSTVQPTSIKAYTQSVTVPQQSRTNCETYQSTRCSVGSSA